MIEPRSVDQHVALFVAFAAGVSQLSPRSWDRLRLRCAGLNGPAFRSLVNRALLASKPFQLSLPAHRTGTLRAIHGVSRVVQTSLAFAFEVAAEYEDPNPADFAPPNPRARTGKPATDAYIDGTFLIETAVGPLQRTDPGVATAVRAAGQAVLRHDWLTPADFAAVYEFVEPEIPFADLEPP